MKLREAREAALVLTNGVALGMALWLVLDADGYGPARVWGLAHRVSGRAAAELGAFSLRAERRYWEEVGR